MQKYRILCVDDQEVNLFALKLLLEKQAEFDVYTISSGEAALKWLLKNRADLILLDMMMPGMSGFETAKYVRSNPATASTPIIYVTARTDENSVTEAFANGGNDYISKPIHTEELFARMRMQLQLVAKEHEIRQHMTLIEEMIENQNNMVLITDGHRIYKANNNFMRYFGIENEKKCEHFSLWLKEHCAVASEWEYLLEKADTHEKASGYMKFFSDLHDEPMYVKTDIVSLGKSKRYVITLTDVGELQEKNSLLEYYATHDPLTGLNNRRAMDETISRLYAQFQRYRTPLSVILFDIDNFKQINDEYGHLKGDDVLRAIARHVKLLRQSDIGYRYGGEEFMIILPGITTSQAKIVAMELRHNIEVDHSHGMKNVTCSFGVSAFSPEDTVESVLERVDKALYQAKRADKNCVEVIE